MKPKVNIILPVHNRAAITIGFIHCLLRQTYKNFQLVLVDDGSTDGTSSKVLELLPKTVVLRGDGNLWWAGGLQMGREWVLNNCSNHEIALMINDDVFIEDDFLEKAVDEFGQCQGRVFFFTPTYSKQTGKLLDAGVRYNFERFRFNSPERGEAVNCLSTRGLFCSIAVFKEVGPFFPDKLPHYFSDYEFTIRGIQMGVEPVIASGPRLLVNEATTGHRDMNTYQVKDFFKLYFSKRYTMNPYYCLTFIWLSNPSLRLKLVGSCIVLKRSLFHISSFLLKKTLKLAGGNS